MSRGGRKFSWRWSVVAAAVALLVGGIATGPSAQVLPNTPDVVGQWTAPFEEGGAGVPACNTDGEGRITCKPVGYSSSVLPDGRILYFNGVEGAENVQYAYGSELSVETRNSLARVMDLRSGTPQWTIPTPEDGGNHNSEIQPGNEGGLSDPYGTAGVPGRPGDGPVGSTVGQIAPKEPKNSPDDRSRNDSDMFCGDVQGLADGRLLIAGGTDFYNEPAGPERDESPTGAAMGSIEVTGIKASRIFDPATNSFTFVGDMTHPRWYPAMAPLPDGKVLVVGGVVKLVKSTQGGNVRRTETFDPATGQWTVNYTGMGSENSLPLLPRLHLAPNGKIFYGGTGQGFNPFGQAVDEAAYALQQFFNPATKQWEVVGMGPLGARGTAAEVPLPLEPPYDEMTIVSFGGTLGPAPSSWMALPFTSLVTVSASGKVTNKMVGNLHHARWFSSGVLLPDGQVLAVNGGSNDELVSPGFQAAIRTPELFDPKTGQWTEVASQTRERTYHSSAILLPDMRVLVGGHAPAATMYGRQADAGPGFANNDRDPSFEIWSPPYLFRGARPSITEALAGVAWGETFPVTTPDAADIESVQLIKLPSVEHTIDPDQRAVKLAFTRDGDVLSAVAPPHGAIAPPGPYYLVVNKKSDKGPIPSLARIVFVGATSNKGSAPQPFTEGTGTSVGSATEPQDSGYFSNAPSMLSKAVEQGLTADEAVVQALPTSSTKKPVSPLMPAAVLTGGLAIISVTRRWRMWRAIE